MALVFSRLFSSCPVSSSGPVRPRWTGRARFLRSAYGLLYEGEKPWIPVDLETTFVLSCRPVVGFCLLACFVRLVVVVVLDYLSIFLLFFDRDYLRGCTVASRAIHALHSHLYPSIG